MGVTPSAWRACFLQSPVRVPGSGREQADVPGSRDKQAGGRSWGNGALTRHTLLRQRRGSPPLPREGPVPARLPRAVEGLPARSADTWHAVLNHLLNLPGDRGLCPSQPAPARTSAGRHLHHHSCCSAVCGVHGEMDGQTHATGWWHRLETSWPSAHRPHLHKTRLDSAVGNAPGAKRFTSQLATRGHRLPVLLAEAGPPRGPNRCTHTHFPGSPCALGELVVITRLQTGDVQLKMVTATPQHLKKTPVESRWLSQQGGPSRMRPASEGRPGALGPAQGLGPDPVLSPEGQRILPRVLVRAAGTR